MPESERNHDCVRARRNHPRVGRARRLEPNLSQEVDAKDRFKRVGTRLAVVPIPQSAVGPRNQPERASARPARRLTFLSQDRSLI
jgi:hypothetical protein